MFIIKKAVKKLALEKLTEHISRRSFKLKLPILIFGTIKISLQLSISPQRN